MKSINEYINESIYVNERSEDSFIANNPLLNGGYDSDKLQKIISDLTKNNKKLPSSQEFENACKRVAVLKSIAALEVFLDDFKQYLNTDGILIKSGEVLDKIFVMHEIYDYIQNHPLADDHIHFYNTVFKDFFDYWKVNWETIPDYSEGLNILTDAYNRMK